MFARPGGQNESSEPRAHNASPPLQTLRLNQTTAFPSPAPNALRSGTKCDSQADIFLQAMYINFSRPTVAGYDPISELVMDSKQIVNFGAMPPLPTDRYPHPRWGFFQVDSSGTLYALLFTRRDAESEGQPRPGPEYYIGRFNADGTVDSLTHLEPPPNAGHWFAWLFGIFPGGGFLVAGTTTPIPGRPTASSWGSFTAIYDSRGRFVREVKLPADVENNFRKQNAESQQAEDGASGPAAPNAAAGPVGMGEQSPGLSKEPPKSTQPDNKSNPQQFFSVAISNGKIVSAPDGNVWILRTSDPLRFYAVNSAGEVVKHFQFPAPALGLRAFDIGLAGPGKLYFEFVHAAGEPGNPSWPSEVIGVFNTDSGEFNGVYKLPDSDKRLSVLACTDGHGGFLYVGSTSDNHLAVFDYTP